MAMAAGVLSPNSLVCTSISSALGPFQLNNSKFCRFSSSAFCSFQSLPQIFTSLVYEIPVRQPNDLKCSCQIVAGLQRCGKSCRLRWINYLRPDLKRGAFSQEEEDLIIELHAVLGNR
jgi:hypothetical protein